jgi:hypothetical protein
VVTCITKWLAVDFKVSVWFLQIVLFSISRMSETYPVSHPVATWDLLGVEVVGV